MYKTTMKDVYECVERLGKFYAVYSADMELCSSSNANNCARSIWNCGFNNDDVKDILEAVAADIKGEFDEDDYDNGLINSGFIDFIGDYICDGGQAINYFEVGLYALNNVDLYESEDTCGLSEKSFEAIRRFFGGIQMQVANLCLDKTKLRTDEEVTFNLAVPYVFENETAKALMEDFKGYADYDYDDYETAFEEIENNVGAYSDATKRRILSMFNNVMYQYDDVYNDVYMCVNTITDELCNKDFYVDNNCEVSKEKEM